MIISKYYESYCTFYHYFNEFYTDTKRNTRQFAKTEKKLKSKEFCVALHFTVIRIGICNDRCQVCLLEPGMHKCF